MQLKVVDDGNDGLIGWGASGAAWALIRQKNMNQAGRLHALASDKTTFFFLYNIDSL